MVLHYCKNGDDKRRRIQRRMERNINPGWDNHAIVFCEFEEI